MITQILRDRQVVIANASISVLILLNLLAALGIIRFLKNREEDRKVPAAPEVNPAG